MDLMLIVGSMGIGAFVGWAVLAWSFPAASNEFWGMGGIAGGVVGILIGYLFAWQVKQKQLARKRPKPAPARREIPPQIVGSHCASCDQRMMIISDGHVCPGCGRVFCIKCEANLPCRSCRSHSQEEPTRGEPMQGEPAS